MSLKSFLDTLTEDLRRHQEPDQGPLSRAQALLETQGVWATVVYRWGQWVYHRPRPVLGVPAKLAYKLLAKCIEVSTGISLPASVQTGPGFYIGHFGTIIVHPRTVMGRGCSIGQGVTIGTRGQGDEGVPVFGDNVYIGAGAKVLGGIRIGSNVSIGANAVVVRDVPDDSVAVGVPAKVLPRR